MPAKPQFKVLYCPFSILILRFIFLHFDDFEQLLDTFLIV